MPAYFSISYFRAEIKRPFDTFFLLDSFQFSFPKADVFSYGIILCEIITMSPGADPEDVPRSNVSFFPTRRPFLHLLSYFVQTEFAWDLALVYFIGLLCY